MSYQIKANLFFKNLIDLIRINKITGVWLLFSPCLFGIFASYKTNQNFDLKLTILLFFLGSFFMRSAGCIINDIIDRKFDKKVKRTKDRPIANQKINIYLVLTILIVLLGSGLAILLQFNQKTIIIGFGAFLLVIIYPFAKRFTYFPQLFLAITFNIGLVIASSAINNSITLPIIFLYVSCIFWTVTYDTIYAYQDIEDDLKIGIKSSAIKFGDKPQKILYILTSLQIIFLGLAGFFGNFKMEYYLFIYLVMFHILCQIKTCDFKDPKSCLEKFKSNSMAGVGILLAILVA